MSTHKQCSILPSDHIRSGRLGGSASGDQACRRDRGVVVHLQGHAPTCSNQLLQIFSGAPRGVPQVLPISILQEGASDTQPVLGRAVP